MNKTLQEEFEEKFPIGKWTSSQNLLKFNIKAFIEAKIEEAYQKGFIEGSDLTGRLAGETHAIELEEAKQKEKERVKEMIEGARFERFMGKEMHGLHMGVVQKEGFKLGWNRGLSLIKQSIALEEAKQKIT